MRIIGTSEDKRGESVKAILVIRPERRGSITEEAIIAWCREHMAAYEVTRRVEFVESLPESGTGKTLWRELQEKESAMIRCGKSKAWADVNCSGIHGANRTPAC